MKLAVLGDIHGNLRAFEAVLTDAKASQVDQIIFLGDLVYMGLDPQLCYDLLMEQNPLVAIKGNTDEVFTILASFHAENELQEQEYKLMKYTDIRMHEKAKQKVSQLPSTKRLEIGSFSLLCCHGSPYDSNEALRSDEPFSPSLSKKLAQEHVDIILSAHTHKSADFVREGIRFINPGAVGYSLDGDVRASYALLTIEGSEITSRIHKVEYDIKRYIREVEHALQGFPLFKNLLQALEQGRRIPE
ncbi:MAG: metallophosphoesterase [Sphaerochaeta sp.]|jgi:putative phosphoesterase|uniref:metallophosphoesterase family protein n=1 Tax=Sphaerochaeta sp. TaxID=1972642 RepID=UPI002FCBF50E